jgi:hypothetical protein
MPLLLPIRALCSIRTLGSFRPLCSVGTLGALCSVGTLGAVRALCSLRALASRRPIRTLPTPPATTLTSQTIIRFTHRCISRLAIVDRAVTATLQAILVDVVGGPAAAGHARLTVVDRAITPALQTIRSNVVRGPFDPRFREIVETRGCAHAGAPDDHRRREEADKTSLANAVHDHVCSPFPDSHLFGKLFPFIRHNVLGNFPISKFFLGMTPHRLAESFLGIRFI